METDLFDRVREGCRTVAERAVWVHIDYGRIPEYAGSLPIEQATLPPPDAGRHFLGHGDDTAAFFLTLDAINFGSGYFPHLRKRPGMSGYFTVASSLTDFYRERGPLSANSLAVLTATDCTRIFGQDEDNDPVQALMRLFAAALNALGEYLLAEFQGGFVALIESAGRSAERLARRLIEMPYFNDVASHHGQEVPFYKRAQLTAADLALAFHGQGLGWFDDLDQLTIFADNLVPHVLRVDEVLIYDKSLADRIDAEALIPAGSSEEIELRACAVHAVELMVNELRHAGREANAMRLDYVLWNRGQQLYYKTVRPRHRTRTVFY
jgi:hypothetical protein